MNNIIDLNEFKNKKQSKNTMIIENTNSIREEWINELLEFEPKLYKIVNNIFGDSYEYTRKHREFKERM